MYYDDPMIAIAEEGGDGTPYDRDDEELQWLDAYGTAGDYADYEVLRLLILKTRGGADRLQVGDIIRVHNPLMSPENALFPVLRIVGNKAFTGFRTFNTRVYHGSYVYEFGARARAKNSNAYTVEGRASAVFT